jgi:hypothetical protein
VIVYRRGPALAGRPGIRETECYDGRVVKAPLAALALLLVSAPALHAQTDSVIGVGGSVSLFAPSDPNVSARPGFGLVGRLRRGTGLGFSLGLDWFTSDVETEVDGGTAPLGALTARPIMMGASYSRQFARFALTAGLVGGWSFNSITQTSLQRKLYGDAVGIQDPQVSVANCWVARPSFTVWHELDNHFAMQTSVGYMFLRPTVTTRGAGGQRSDSVNLGSVVFSIGFVYGVF